MGEHGTLGGYKRHQRIGDLPACEPCLAALRAYEAVRRTRPPLNPAPTVCGTYAGYHGHIRRLENTCADCRDANAAYHRRARARRRNVGG